MKISIEIDSEKPGEVRQARRIFAILDEPAQDTAHGDVEPPLATPPADPTSRTTELARTRTGEPLRRVAQNYLAGQRFTLLNVAGLMPGWDAAKAKSWYAKFSRTCKAWRVNILERHPGTPKRYSMTEEVRQAVLAALPAPAAPPVAEGTEPTAE